MAINITGIRAGIETRLKTIDGLRCYPTIPEKPESPAAVVVPSDPFIEYQGAMGRGLVTLSFDIVLLAARSLGAERAQALIDPYLDSGADADQSVIDAIEADTTLGGLVGRGATAVRTAGGYGTTEIGTLQYMTARVHVDVITDRK